MRGYEPAGERAETRYQIDAARLWAGGAATAVVAGLVAVVGILIVRGLTSVAILAPKGSGVWGNANTVTYALLSAAAGLLATALMHLLAVTTPSASQFFGWIMMLLTLIAVVLPLSIAVDWPSKIATALLNLAIGVVITIVVTSMAANATRRYRKTHPPRQAESQYPQSQYPRSQYYDDYTEQQPRQTRRWDY